MTWQMFVDALRVQLSATERAYLDRRVTKLDDAARGRIFALGVDVAVQELRREMGGRMPPLTTRSAR